MDLLTIIAQIIVVLATFLWVVLKGAWNLVYFVYELARDYTPLLAKKMGRLLKSLSKRAAPTRSEGVSIVPELVSVPFTPVTETPQYAESISTPVIEAISLPVVQSQPILTHEPTYFAEEAFFDRSTIVATQSGSALFSGLFSLLKFTFTVLIKLFGFVLTLVGFIVSFFLYLIKALFNLVLGLFGMLSGIKLHIPEINTSGIKAPSVKIPTKALSRISLVGMVITAVLLLGLIFPDIAMTILPYKTEAIETAVDSSVLGGNFHDATLYTKLELPERNEYLPDGNWLSIPKIGVLTEINEASPENHEDALRKGVWRVQDFANPTEGKDYPTILIAHRFGYLAWSNQFRRQNSFYNVDKLQIGDTFEIIWDKRKFVYEIYAGAEGKEITDYKADVVLYTCKYLNSPIRLFRYARRVEY